MPVDFPPGGPDLMKRSPSVPIVNLRLPVNTQGVDWICSDLHGQFPVLKEMLKEVEFNDQTDRLILLGDLIDRGPSSLETLSWVLSAPFCFSVMGNHELLFWASTYHPELIEKHLRLGGEWSSSLSLTQRHRLVQGILSSFPLTLTLELSMGDIGIVHSQSPFDDWGDIESSEFSEALAKRCTWEWARSHQNTKALVRGVLAVVSGHIGSNHVVQNGNQLWIDTIENTGKPTLLSATQILQQYMPPLTRLSR